MRGRCLLLQLREEDALQPLKMFIVVLPKSSVRLLLLRFPLGFQFFKSLLLSSLQCERNTPIDIGVCLHQRHKWYQIHNIRLVNSLHFRFYHPNHRRSSSTSPIATCFSIVGKLHNYVHCVISKGKELKTYVSPIFSSLS